MSEMSEESRYNSLSHNGWVGVAFGSWVSGSETPFRPFILGT